MKSKPLIFSLLAAICFCTVSATLAADALRVAESQAKYIGQYAKQKLLPKPEAMLVNTDSEPDLSAGFITLYNGKNLDGWTVRGGSSLFEPRGETIYGETINGSPNTYLCTNKADYADFVFTAEFRVDGNSGIMVRANAAPGKKYENVTGPQIEVEEGSALARGRLWTGGIYGQGIGGWIYPLWLEQHAEARAAVKEGEWTRVTVEARGDTIKTWVNGVPAAYWRNDTFPKGFIALQIHSGKAGTQYLFRNIKVKELEGAQ